MPNIIFQKKKNKTNFQEKSKKVLERIFYFSAYFMTLQNLQKKMNFSKVILGHLQVWWR